MTLRGYRNSISILFGATRMEISSSNLTFHISLVDINALKPHEEVINHIVKSLSDAVKAQGIVRDPLIVDQDTYVILDGMHRYSSLKLLECRFAPCCLVDYSNPMIKVGSWFRLFTVNEAEELARKVMPDSEPSYAKLERDIEQLDPDYHTIILTKNGSRYSLKQTRNPTEFTKTAITLEQAIVALGYHVDYQTEEVALQSLRSGIVDLVIRVPIFTKQQITDFGVHGSLLPHKVTRHIMPSRPLRVDIPLDMLTKQGKTKQEANRELHELLSARRVQEKPPGSVVDGRRYEEETLIFTA